MKTKNISLLIALLFFAASTSAAEQKLSPQELEKLISQALPDKPQAQPKQKRKVLLCDLARAYKHDTATAIKALAMLGEKTGAYEPVHSEDITLFEPDNIKQFAAIVLVSTSGPLFAPDPNLEGDQLKTALARQETLQKSFADYISNGGGLVGLHACTISFCDWPQFGEILGAYFSFHPTASKVWVKNEKPDHPINAALMGEDFQIFDEIYRFTDRDSEYCRFAKQPYSRQKLRVLLSLDFSKEKKNARDRADGDAAISWIKPYGQGRVFYCGLGHFDEEYTNPMLLGHFLAGIQYAAGDLEADDAPDKALQTSEEGFTSLFDGNDLSGWDCDPRFWSVKDGAIIGQVAEGTKVDNHTYAIWKGGPVKDFELRMKVRWTKGNSGIDYRAERIEKDRHGRPLKWTIEGYQADITEGWMCSLYNWNKPGAQPGQFVIVEAENMAFITTMELADPNFLRRHYFDPGGWNEFTIIARGSHIIERLNGYQTVEFIDNGPQARKEGLIGMQVHTGSKAQLFEFKDIWLKPIDNNFGPAKLLFNGKDLDGWGVSKEAKRAWHVKDGALVCDGPGITFAPGAYADFVLRFQFRGDPGSTPYIFAHQLEPIRVEYIGKGNIVADNIWRECELLCQSGKYELKVANQTAATGTVGEKTGKIGLGKAGPGNVEFRNIVLIPAPN
jgi:hypothetical protein